MERGEFEVAADRLNQAIEFAPNQATPHFELARCLRMLNRHEEALTSLERGLAFAPSNPEGRLRLATVLVDLGRLAEAKAIYRALIRRWPNLGTAYYGLSLIENFSAGDAEVAQMERIVETTSLSEREQSNLHFALGRVYDQLGDHERAFGHFRRGNDLRRRLFRFDIEAERVNTQRIIRAFKRGIFSKAGSVGHATHVPVFILGMPRSGTSLVEQILASHPDVYGGGELNLLWQAAALVSDALPAGHALPEAAGDVPDAAWREAGEQYLSRVRSFAPEAARITDKLPFNYTMVGLIRMMLPEAKVIHCLRDPMDTCLSCYFTAFEADRGFTNDLRDLGTTYRLYSRLMAHWHEVMPGFVQDVQYERIVEDLEPEARRLVQHIGLEWSPECLKFHMNDRAVRTASHAQVRRPLYKTSIGRWKPYIEYLDALRTSLGTKI